MDEIRFLRFEDMQEEVARSKLREPWITVYECRKDKKEDWYTNCGLVPNKENVKRKILKDIFWEVNSECGIPGYWVRGSERRIRYERFLRTPRGIRFEPLVIVRSFYGLKDEYVELCEKFRLYYNLFHNRPTDEYVFIAESGEDHIVAKMEKVNSGLRVQVKTEYLRGFLAAKSMLLVRSHDHTRYSKEVGQFSERDNAPIQKIGVDFCYRIVINRLPISSEENWRTRSIFLGKDILPPLPEPLHEVYRFLTGERDRQFADFIIDTNEGSKPITNTCNPDTLSNFFGKNPGAPHYLTPVYFEREVLREYHSHPSKYRVEDNLIRCGVLWTMHYDLNRSGFVVARLGDLGTDLPYNEQLQWKRFNVPPEGGLSEKMIRRDILAEFTEPDEITQIFKYEFIKFSDFWKSRFGWSLFLPLRKDDEQYIRILHVPTTEDPYEFEQMISALAKVLPASINEKELKRFLRRKVEGSINLLQEFLVSHLRVDEQRAKTILQPLRDIQSLRSEGIAHRKDENYDEIAKRLGLKNESYIWFFEGIMMDVVKMFKQLRVAAGIE